MRVRRVCQLLLMCATTSQAQAGQSRCAASDLAESGTDVPPGPVFHGVTVWHTVNGSPAPHAMTTTHPLAELLAIREADREAAHDHGCEAYNAIEALQSTHLWLELPVATRRALSAAHAHLGALTDAIAS